MGRPIKDLTGQKFGRLTVLKLSHVDKGGNVHWLCKCDCGRETIVCSNSLQKGQTKSCGCKKNEFEDLSGQKFGRLAVIKPAGKNTCGKRCWLCRCDCGNEVVVSAGNLKSGNSLSCGCLKAKTHSTHKMSNEHIYQTWSNMKQRCLNPKHPQYKDWGERGIKVCDRWLNSFESFYEDVSKLPHFGEKGYSLDRIDNNGDYCPENIRWSDKVTQNRNQRRIKATSVIVKYNGEELTLTETAKKIGVPCSTLCCRLKRGETGNYLFRPSKKTK